MDLKRFKQLLESKLGDVKPLVTEETTTLPQTEDEFKKLLTSRRNLEKTAFHSVLRSHSAPC